jgi:hypothetical protein
MTILSTEQQHDRFVAIDGDNVGRRLEQLVAEEKEEDLLAFAVCVETQLQRLRLEIESCGGRILLCSGDSILARVAYGSLDEICAVIPMGGPITFSVGIGSQMSQAMYALKAAKALGRARVIEWGELVGATV